MSGPCINCPAGERVWGTPRGRACVCRVEHSLVTLPRDQRVVPSLVAFCEGDYASCPTWRAERARRVARPLVRDERDPGPEPEE